MLAAAKRPGPLVEALIKNGFSDSCVLWATPRTPAETLGLLPTLMLVLVSVPVVQKRTQKVKKGDDYAVTVSSGIPGSSSDGANKFGSEVPHKIETVSVNFQFSTVSMDLTVAMGCSAEGMMDCDGVQKELQLQCFAVISQGILYLRKVRDFSALC